MCEHCGCRDNPEVGKLGREHDAIVELADQVLAEVGAGAETVAGAAARLRELILPHVRGEEAGVFKVADEMGLRDEYIDDLEEDHRKFDGAFTQPGSMGPNELEQILDELYHHIAIEEYDLFPVVGRELSARTTR